LRRGKIAPADEASERALLQELQARFGRPFNVMHSLHYSIVYDTDEEFAQSRARVFEKVFRSYFGFFENLDFELKMPQAKLQVLLFDGRLDFARYIGAPNPMATPDGLYFHEDRQVVFYNAISDEVYQNIRGSISQITDNISQLEAQLRRVNAGARITIIFPDGRRIVVTKHQAERILRDNRDDLEKRKKEMIGFLKTQNVVTTAHEGTHQLMAATGLFPFMEDAPLWLNEGLATFIEASYRGRWVGVGTINQERLKVFKEAVEGAPGRTLHPLKDLLSRESLLTSGTRSSILVAYSEVWALVYYLTKTRRDEFVSYLDYVQKRGKRARQDERTRGEENLEEFKKFFDEDISAFEKEWIEYVRNLQ
jgi:hypothetical protein